MFEITLRYSSLSILVNIIIIYCATLIGQLQNPPSILLLTDGFLCYTQSCEDTSRFRSNQDYVSPVITQMDNEHGIIDYAKNNIRIRYSTDDSNSLNLHIQDSSGTGLMQLGDVIAYFESPCSLTITEKAVFIQFEKFFVQTNPSFDLSKSESLNMFLSPRLLIDSVDIYSNPIPCDTPVTFPTSHNITSIWYGFNSLSFYLPDAK